MGITLKINSNAWSIDTCYKLFDSIMDLVETMSARFCNFRLILLLHDGKSDIEVHTKLECLRKLFDSLKSLHGKYSIHHEICRPFPDNNKGYRITISNLDCNIKGYAPLHTFRVW